MIFSSVVVLLPVSIALLVWLYGRYHRFTARGIKDIPGPPSTSWLYGNLSEFYQAQAGVKESEWREIYGNVIRLTAPFGQNHLMLFDSKALQYITQTGAYRYPKNRERKALSYALVGTGLVWADGDRDFTFQSYRSWLMLLLFPTGHKAQRKVMLPGFGGPEARALLPIFSSAMAKMASKWEDLIGASPDQSVVIDVHAQAARASLDIIGEAAFDYQFGAQDDADNALAKAYTNFFFDTFRAPSQNNILFLSLLQIVPQWLIYWFFDSFQVERFKHARATSEIATTVARDLLKEKREQLLQGEANRDILSLIVKSNAGEDPKHKMSDQDMLAQLRTLMVAGHETTANSFSWILLELSRHPDVQTRLRKEIHNMENKRKGYAWTWQELENMPYLTAVVKEGLRLYPVAYVLQRQAAEDDVIPLSSPITTTTGRTIRNIPIQKGQKLTLSLIGYNRSKDIFGEDADVFNPDRWLNRSLEKAAVPSVGVYGNLMTFSAGTRSCIGWRFAVLELHAMLVETISKLEFLETPESKKLRLEGTAVITPTIEGQVEKGAQLPLRIKIASREEA